MKIVQMNVVLFHGDDWERLAGFMLGVVIR